VSAFDTVTTVTHGVAAGVIVVQDFGEKSGCDFHHSAFHRCPL